MGESRYEASRQRLLDLLRNFRRLHPHQPIIHTYPTAEERRRAEELIDEIGEDVIRSRK